jgi:hypothetical protein
LYYILQFLDGREALDSSLVWVGNQPIVHGLGGGIGGSIQIPEGSFQCQILCCEKLCFQYKN